MTTRIGEAWPPDELEEVPECPVCGSRDRSVLHGELRDLLFRCAPGLWTFHRCLHCSSPYLDPRPTRSSIGRAYSSYYTHELGSDRGGPLAKVQLRLRYGFLNQTRGYRLSPAGRAGAWVVRMLPQERGRALKEVRHLPGRGGGMRVLDVGCGSGGFLDLMRWPGWIVQGLEPDQEAVDLARRRGLDVMHGTVDRLADYPASSFDAVTMSHVIKHLHDPVASLRACARLLARDGLMYIATPNLDARGHAIFGPHWIGIDAPRHLVLFTWDSLEDAARAAGLTVIGAARGSWDERWIDVNSRVVRDRSSGGTGDVRAGLQLRARATNWRGWLRPRQASEIAIICRLSDPERNTSRRG